MKRIVEVLFNNDEAIWTIVGYVAEENVTECRRACETESVTITLPTEHGFVHLNRREFKCLRIGVEEAQGQ